MSLTIAQTKATHQEFIENIDRSGLSIEEIADALVTTPEVIRDSINMQPNRIEDNWIIRNFLIQYMADHNIEPVPFTVLVGDYHNYWFLNDRIVARGTIG